MNPSPLIRSLKKIANFIVYSNLFIAFCALALSLFTLRILAYENEAPLLAFIFFSTLFAYNFQRKLSLIYHSTRDSSNQNRWINENKKWSNLITVFSFLASFYFLYQLPHETILLIAPLAIISLLYVLQIGNQPALRNIPFLKVFVVAFVWGGAMILLPIIYFEAHLSDLLSLKAQSLTLALALFVFGQSLPFDIRDIGYDQKQSLRTIPSKMGIAKTLLICWLSFALSIIVMSYAFISAYISQHSFLSFCLAILLSSLVIYFSKREKHHLFYGIVLESCLCIPIVIYTLLK